MYSHGVSFSPIIEETSEAGSRTRASTASSKYVPSSWGSHPDDYNFNRIQDRIEEEDDARNSPASPYSTASMHDDTTGLVRQASMGKKMKPSLTRIRSSSDNVSAKKETIGLGAISAGVAGGAIDPSREKDPNPAARSDPSVENIGNRTIIIDSSPSSSRPSSAGSGKSAAKVAEPMARSRSPLSSSADRSARQVVSPLFSFSRPIPKAPSTSEKVPSGRRPPHLDMEAVRDLESRGSITSLPDLIRRATKLAANLDRGKTASRLDMLATEKTEEKRRSGSISDILASFPPPSRGAPDATRSGSRWPSPFSASKLNQRMSYLTSHESGSTHEPPNRRRCCGLSICTFLIILLVLTILVAAAIVLPVVLIELPRQRRAAAANDDDQTSLGHCPGSTPCQNGGVSVVVSDTCRCTCVSGFTGDRCQTVADLGCVTTDIGTGSEQVSNATVGNAIPRLLSGASTNYSIPLNSSAILGLFSTFNLSCTSENALVTFNGQAMKARDIVQQLAGGYEPSLAHTTSLPLATPTTTAVLPPRLEQRQAVTSNGIIFQQTSTIAPLPTSSADPSPKDSDSASQTSSQSPSSETLDFARIAVLFVLQQSGQLDTAVNAQDNIQHYLFSGAHQKQTNLSLSTQGVDLNLNFTIFSILLGNGTEVGGNGNGNGGIKGR